MKNVIFHFLDLENPKQITRQVRAEVVMDMRKGDVIRWWRDNAGIGPMIEGKEDCDQYVVDQVDYDVTRDWNEEGLPFKVIPSVYLLPKPTVFHWF